MIWKYASTERLIKVRQFITLALDNSYSILVQIGLIDFGLLFYVPVNSYGHVEMVW